MYLTIKSCYLGPFDVYPTPKIKLSVCSLVCSSQKSPASYKADACTMRPLSKSSSVYDAVMMMMVIITRVRCSHQDDDDYHPRTMQSLSSVYDASMYNASVYDVTGYLSGSHGLSGRRAQRTKSKGPKGLQQ